MHTFSTFVENIITVIQPNYNVHFDRKFNPKCIFMNANVLLKVCTTFWIIFPSKVSEVLEECR